MDQHLLTVGGMESNIGREVTRACDMCRRKKIKCDWKTPSCGPCVRYKTKCIYTPTLRAKPGSKRRPKSDLESRLARMENVLGLVGESSTDHDTYAELSSSTMWDVSINAVETIPDPRGEMVQIQPRPHSPTGLTTEFNVVERPDHQSLLPKVFSLPPLSEALPLMQLYFTNFNQFFPLFHELSFMDLVAERYLGHSQEDPAWYASINAILSLGCRLRAMTADAHADDDRKSMEYLQNASAVAQGLMLYGSSLSAVQALLAIALIVHGTSSPGCYAVLVAAAVRLSHMIGLNKHEQYESALTAVEPEQRKRVFWIAYILDKDVSFRSDIPPIQHDDEMSVGLPIQDAMGRIGFLDVGIAPYALDLFGLRIRLSVIQNMIYKRLYSPKASYQTQDERANAIQELEAILKGWRGSIPFDFSPESVSRVLGGTSVVHIIILHFLYFYSLMKIHRPPLQGISSQTKSLQSIESFNPRLFASEPSCISAARESIALIKLAPQGNCHYIWLILYPSVSAMITLLHNVLHHPYDHHAHSDLQLVEPLINTFAILAGDEKNKEVFRIHLFCLELRRRAITAMHVYEATYEGTQGRIEGHGIDNGQDEIFGISNEFLY